MNRPRSTLPAWFHNHRPAAFDHDNGRGWVICLIVMFAVSLLIVGVLVLYFGTKDIPAQDQQQDVALSGKIHSLPPFNRTVLDGGKFSMLHRFKGQEGLNFKPGEHGASASSGSPLALSDQDLKQLSKLSQQEQLLQLIQRLLKINELEKLKQGQQETTAAPTTPPPPPKEGGDKDSDEAQRLIELLLNAIQGPGIQVAERSKLELDKAASTASATSERKPPARALPASAARGDAPTHDQDHVPPQDDDPLARLNAIVGRRGMNLPIHLRKK